MNNNNNELELLRERYLKLVDVHGQLQVQNSLLEERILITVDEKTLLEQTLLDAKQQITNLQGTINQLEIDKQRYKDDCNLAVRLLHRYPNEFISTTSGQIQEQLKNRLESSTNQPIPSQRPVLLPTFPPTFIAPPPLLATTTAISSVNTQTTPSDSLRLAAEALFKSNSVHRSPSTQFVCSDCHRTVKRCDVSVQTSLDDNATSRLRLISLTASDDGLTNDGTWLSLDSSHAQEYQTNNTRQTLQGEGYGEVSGYSIPGMYYV